MTSRTWDAHRSIHNAHDMQLGIDRLVWQLRKLDQALGAFRVTHDFDRARRFGEAKVDIRNTLESLTKLAGRQPQQLALIEEFSRHFTTYSRKLDLLLRADHPVDRAQHRSVIIESDQLSILIEWMRKNADALLLSHASRADRYLNALLPALLAAAVAMTLLMLVTGRSINRTISEKDRALAAKSGEIAARDLLMREVDHRARNNLALVYNLMNFQQQRANSDAARSFLAEAANQVLVVARLHERLYKSDEQDVTVEEYLRDLCDDIAAYSLPANARNALTINAQCGKLHADQAIWIGLIVVELVTNALKYAKPAVDAPVVVDVSRSGSALRVAVSDRGPGLPANFDTERSTGFGMRVVHLLVKQLHGELQIDRSWPGARFVLHVPLRTTARQAA